MLQQLARLFVFLAIALPALAHPLTGTWEGERTIQDRKIPISFTFTMDGTTLRGTAANPGGSPTALDNLAVIDRAIKFTAGSGNRGFAFDGTCRRKNSLRTRRRSSMPAHTRKRSASSASV